MIESTAQPPRGPRLQVNDPNMMRALAHPARLKIVALLMNGVEATATECAEYCGLSPSATSYHLRALAKFGIIEEAQSRGDARERVWRSAYGGMTFETIGNDEDFGGADLALADAMVAHQDQATREFLKRSDELPKEWEEGAGLIHSRLMLTADEGKELLRKVDELLDPYRRNDNPARPDTVQALIMFRLFPELPPRTAAHAQAAPTDEGPAVAGRLRQPGPPREEPRAPRQPKRPKEPRQPRVPTAKKSPRPPTDSPPA